ncbi:major royal jelly family protein [Beijerinckia sp. L45]|uniref:major royal jelly family protein n=1 Tax=Beijerinckia sp. L45 TaxID=1641855 RepID=UPI001FF07699|nr:major royal jelly family protein [Beijerinckia sp. L45]
MVNSVHVFDDDTLWVVDQGAPPGNTPAPGAQKLVQVDAVTGRLLSVLRFGTDILPPGAQMNDLRVHGEVIYVTDSGVGGVIVHDLANGRTIRRLSGHPSLRQQKTAAMKGKGGRVLADDHDERPTVHSDMLEVTDAGDWIYLSAPTGPLLRLPTDPLRDRNVTDERLAGLIETVAEIPTIGGTGIDTLGNLLLSDVENRQILVLAPTGERAVLVTDDRLVSPDALFIDHNRRLYIPAPQIEYLAQHDGGEDRTNAPFLVFAMDLPTSLDGHPLGAAVTGRPG